LPVFFLRELTKIFKKNTILIVAIIPLDGVGDDNFVRRVKDETVEEINLFFIFVPLSRDLTKEEKLFFALIFTLRYSSGIRFSQKSVGDEFKDSSSSSPDSRA